MSGIIIGGEPGPHIIEGSKEYKCTKCKKGVMIAPSGQDKIEEMKLSTYCLKCATSVLSKEVQDKHIKPPKIRLPTLQDLRKDYPNHKW